MPFDPISYAKTDVRILEDGYIKLFKACDPKGLKVWTYARDLVYAGKLTWDDVVKFANDVKDADILAHEFNENMYFTDDEIASILNSANLAVDKAVSILNNANITADRVASIAGSINITSSRIKEILDTGLFTDADKIAALLDVITVDDAVTYVNSGIYSDDLLASAFNSSYLAVDKVASIADSTNITSSRIKGLLDTGLFTDADKIAALLDGVITVDDAATHVNSGIYSDDLLASAFNSSYLAVDKGASIFNSANITTDKVATILNNANLSIDKAASILNNANLSADRVASILNSANITVKRAASIISSGNLSGTELIDILINSNLDKDRAASILEGSTRFVRYSFESGENWVLDETHTDIQARITTDANYVTHGSQAFANGSSNYIGTGNYAYAYINTNVANVVGVFYDVTPGNNAHRQQSEIWINDTQVFTSTNHVRNLRFKLPSPTIVTKLEVRSHIITYDNPGIIGIDNIRLVI